MNRIRVLLLTALVVAAATAGVVLASQVFQVQSPVMALMSVEETQVYNGLGLYTDFTATQAVESIGIVAQRLKTPLNGYNQSFMPEKVIVRNEYGRGINLQAPCGVAIRSSAPLPSPISGYGSTPMKGYTIGDSLPLGAALLQLPSKLAAGGALSFNNKEVGGVYANYYSKDGKFVGFSCDDLYLVPDQMVEARLIAHIYFDDPAQLPAGDYQIGVLFAGVSFEAPPTAVTSTTAQ